jgi:hypothetical protein
MPTLDGSGVESSAEACLEAVEQAFQPEGEGRLVHLERIRVHQDEVPVS